MKTTDFIFTGEKSDAFSPVGQPSWDAPEEQHKEWRKKKKQKKSGRRGADAVQNAQGEHGRGA